MEAGENDGTIFTQENSGPSGVSENYSIASCIYLREMSGLD